MLGVEQVFTTQHTRDTESVWLGQWTPHLLVTLPYLPQILQVQLWLHILLTVVGSERDLKGVVPHEVECLLYLEDG